jgi:hypothetical protein
MDFPLKKNKSNDICKSFDATLQQPSFTLFLLIKNNRKKKEERVET